MTIILEIIKTFSCFLFVSDRWIINGKIIKVTGFVI